MGMRTGPLRRHASQPAPAGRHPSLDGSNGRPVQFGITWNIAGLYRRSNGRPSLRASR